MSSRADRNFYLLLAVALAVGAALSSVMPLSRMMAAQNDFVHWYVGGLLFGTPDLHLEGPNHVKQVELIGSVLADSYFIRPTFYGLLLKPLTWMPFLTAYWVYQLYSLGCLAYFLKVFSQGWREIWIFAAMSIPLISNMVNGQDVTSLLLFCTLTIVLARKGRDFAAGLIFSLCAIKFHLFILTPFAMVAHRRWRMFWGAAIGEAALFILGLTGGGWEVFKSLFALLGRAKNHPYPELMPNLRGLVAALADGNLAVLGALYLLVGAVTIFLIFRAPTFEKSFAFAIIAGMVANFHSYIQDPLLLFLTTALLLDGRESKEFRLVAQVLLLPVVYILLLWRPPYSALYTLLILTLLGIALRDLRRQASEAAAVPI